MTMSMDNNLNHRRIPQHDRNLNSNSNLTNLPSSNSNFESELARNYSHSHSSAYPLPSQSYSHLSTVPPTSTTTATTAANMIGASTAFYDDSIHGPGVVLANDGEPDQELYSTYLASFQQQQQQQQNGGYTYSSDFSGSHTQQSYSQSQGHPQYLPTPSVSPTSTSPPSVISPTTRQTRQGPSQQSQYYTLSGAVPMGTTVYSDSSNPSTSNNASAANPGTGTPAVEKRAQGHKKTKSGAAGPVSSTAATANSAKTSPSSSRKRARKSFDRPASPSSQSQSQTIPAQNQSTMQDDSDDEDQEDRNQPTQRLPGACRYCKKLKMRCEFVPRDAATCKRCKTGGHQCIVEGRKPRTGPNKREFLLAQLRQKESIIESLLRQINNPVHQTPLTLLVPNMASVTSNANGTTLPDTIPNTSVKNAGGRGGLAAFSLDKRAEGTSIDLLDDEDADEPGLRRHFDDDGDAGDEDEDDDADDAADPSVSLGGSGKKAKLHYLPEEAAPLGLIADLSLENHIPKKKEKEGSVGAGAKDDAVSQYHPESRGQSAAPANTGAGGAHESSNPNDPSATQGADADANQQPPAEEENENNVGVANKSYFHPGPATDLNLRRVIAERTMPPDILVHGLVTPEDVEELFKIFYERINVFLSILDPAIHTPARTFGRCPFLFTVVCAISSRYYAPKASIYKYAMHFAKSAAASSLIDGWKSIELCQAYLLMSIYAVPARRWEEDRSWLYLGLAIRIATDLNLHQPSSTAVSAVTNTSSNKIAGNSVGSGAGDASVNGSAGSAGGGKLARLQNQNQYPSPPLSSIPSSTSSNLSQTVTSPSTPTAVSSPPNASVTSSKAAEKHEKSEREFLNRTRTWLICFNLDRSISTQLGKPSTIKEDFIIRNAGEWYKRSPYNMPFDIQLCAYTELLRIVTRFHDDVWSGSRGVGSGVGVKAADVDFYTITMHYDDLLRGFQEQAAARFERDSKKDDPGSVYRTGLLPFMVNYSRLVMFSFGFQQAVERGLQRDDIFFQRCFDAACGVITTVVERLTPTGYLRFAPDAHFVFVSFAAAFLLKLLRPDFSRIVNRSHKDQVLTLVRKLIRTLGSPEVAVDDKHTPKLYSRFLAGLVSRYSTRKKGNSLSKVQQNAGNENGQMQMLQGQTGQGHIHAHSSVQGTSDYGSPNSHYDLSSPSQMISPDTLHQQQTGYIPSNSQGYAQNVQYPSVHYDGEPQQAPGHSHVSTLEYYGSSSSSGNTAATPNMQNQHQHFLSDMNMELGGSVQQTQGIGHAQGQGTDQFDDTSAVGLSEHEYLASMQAINNAGWWGHVMMPGFTYPGGNNYTGGQQSQQPVQFGQMDFESDGVVSHSQYSTSQSHNNVPAYSEAEEYPIRFEG